MFWLHFLHASGVLQWLPAIAVQSTERLLIRLPTSCNQRNGKAMNEVLPSQGCKQKPGLDSDTDTDTIEISDLSRLVKQPLVSVLILAYNHEKYLADAIEGVLLQKTDFPLEILIGEDQSTDGTNAVALRFLENYPDRIRILTAKRNVGAMKNFDRLLGHSRGQLLAFCEGDDYWTHSDKLSEQVDYLQKNTGVDISFHSCHFSFGDDGEPVGPYIADRCSRIFSKVDVIRGGGGFMPSASIVIRRDAVDKIPAKVFEKSPMGDYLVQVYGSLKGGAYYINRSMCVYRRGHSTSWNFSLNNIENLLAFETNANATLREMAFDLGHLKRHFGYIIFKYNFQQFIFFNYKNDRARAAVYLAILKKNLDLFSAREKLLAKLASSRFLMLPIFVANRAWRRLATALLRNRYLKYV